MESKGANNGKSQSDRLVEAFQYLYNKGLVHTKREFAEKIGFNGSNLSAAMKGDSRYCTDSLMSKVSIAFPEINAVYLTKGEGSLTYGTEHYNYDSDSKGFLIGIIKSQQETIHKQMRMIQEDHAMLSEIHTTVLKLLGEGKG